MKAARIHAYGGPEQLRVEEAPEPEPGPRDVLIQVHATSINPVDCKMREGALRGLVRLRLPAALGMDVSGVVLAAGSACTRLRPGDEVWSTPHQRQLGTYAERVVIDERHVARKPPSLSHAEAASIPLAGLTAWQALTPLRAGHHALILAGSGGVGTLAIQLAKARGARVTTTCSARNAELVRALGADEVIDYTRQDHATVVKDADLVLDALGDWSAARRSVRWGGHLRSIVGDVPSFTERYGPYLGPLLLGLDMVGTQLTSLGVGVRLAHILRAPSAEQLDELTALIEAGRLRPVVEREYPLEAVAEAHRASESGRTRGKLVLIVKG